MTLATWVLAGCSLVTTVNGLAWIRHGRQDKARFADHADRLASIERNGGGR